MNKKGMTLVEQVVVMAILAIFSLVAVSLLAGAFNMSRRVMTKAEASVISSNVSQVIEDKISVATEVTVMDNEALSVDGSIISTDGNGHLTINGNLHFAPSYYLGNTMELTFTSVNKEDGTPTGIIQFNVDIKNAERTIYAGQYICSSLRSKLTQ